MRRVWAILAFIGACTAGTSTPPGQPTGPATALAFPDRVGNFAIVDRHVFPVKNEGVAARYSDGGKMRVDVYIYPVTGFSAVPDGQEVPPARAIHREVASFEQILDTGKARGWWDHYKVAYEEDASYNFPQGRVPGYLVMTVLARGDTTLADAFYIFDVRNEFVKVRISMPYELFDGARPMTTFTDSLMGQIAAERR